MCSPACVVRAGACGPRSAQVGGCYESHVGRDHPPPQHRHGHHHVHHQLWTLRRRRRRAPLRPRGAAGVSLTIPRRARRTTAASPVSERRRAGRPAGRSSGFGRRRAGRGRSGRSTMALPTTRPTESARPRIFFPRQRRVRARRRGHEHTNRLPTPWPATRSNDAQASDRPLEVPRSAHHALRRRFPSDNDLSGGSTCSRTCASRA